MPRLPDTVECLTPNSAGFENPILEFNFRIQALEDELARKQAIDIGRNKFLMLELRSSFKSLFIKFQRDCSGNCMTFVLPHFSFSPPDELRGLPPQNQSQSDQEAQAHFRDHQH
jgi:hypothetical protein